MNPDVVSGCISLALAIMFILFATGSIAVSKDRQKGREYIQKYGWILWIAALVLGAGGVFRIVQAMG